MSLKRVDYPITEDNLNECIKPQSIFFNQIFIKNFPMLRQDEFGEDFDCTITTMTAILKYYNPGLNVNWLYSIAEREAIKYGYNGHLYGTIPITIKSIFNNILKIFNLPLCKSYYLKNIGFKFDDIVDCINKNKPVILNLPNDGRNYYKNHTVTVIGYRIYNDAKLLVVQDNWHTYNCYIDYDKLSVFSSILY